MSDVITNPHDEITLQDGNSAEDNAAEDDNTPQSDGGLVGEATAVNTDYCAIETAEDGRPYGMWPGKIIQSPRQWPRWF